MDLFTLALAITTPAWVLWVVLLHVRHRMVKGTINHALVARFSALLRPLVYGRVGAEVWGAALALRAGDCVDTAWSLVMATVILWLLSRIPEDDDFWGDLGRKIKKRVQSLAPSPATAGARA